MGMHAACCWPLITRHSKHACMHDAVLPGRARVCRGIMVMGGLLPPRLATSWAMLRTAAPAAQLLKTCQQSPTKQATAEAHSGQCAGKPKSCVHAHRHGHSVIQRSIRPR